MSMDDKTARGLKSDNSAAKMKIARKKNLKSYKKNVV